MLEAAVGAVRAGRLAEAEAHCRHLLNRNPDHPEALRVLATVAVAAGRPASAVPILERAAALAPTSADAHADLGGALLMVGRATEGAAALSRALAIKPSHVRASLNMGLSLLNAGRLDEARRHLDRALKKARDNVDVLIAHGVVAAESGDHGTAIADFRRVLRLCPDHRQALLNLGTALIEAGRGDEAVAMFDRLIAVNPENPRAHFQAGLACAAARRRPAAIRHYEQALAIAPDFAEAHVNVANELRFEGCLESALEHLRAAHALRPRDAPILENTADLLWEMKRADDALAVLWTLHDVQPDEDRTFRRIANILEQEGRFEEEGAVVERWRAAVPGSILARLYALERTAPASILDDSLDAETWLQSSSIEDSERVDICFAFGKACDRAGDHDRAFDFYARGNLLIDARLGHRPDDDAFVERTMRFFDAARLSAFEPIGSPDPRPVFIVGMPRSGTTLTEQIIASHPEAAGAGELTVIPELIGSLQRRAGGTERYPDCLAGLAPTDFEAAARRYLTQLSSVSETARRITDKLPGNFMSLGFIAMLFPNARVIHCRRDPRDTCLSIFFQQFLESHTYAFDLYSLGRFHRAYRTLMEHWRRVLPLPMLEIDYEEIVADLDGTSRRLLEFCELPWDDRVLRFYETRRSIRTASVWQVRQPIYDTSVSRWRHYEKHLGPLECGLAGLPRNG